MFFGTNGQRKVMAICMHIRKLLKREILGFFVKLSRQKVLTYLLYLNSTTYTVFIIEVFLKYPDDDYNISSRILSMLTCFIFVFSSYRQNRIVIRVVLVQELFIKDLARKVYSSKTCESDGLHYEDLATLVNSKDTYGFLDGRHNYLKLVR